MKFSETGKRQQLRRSIKRPTTQTAATPLSRLQASNAMQHQAIFSELLAFQPKKHASISQCWDDKN